MFGKRIKKLVIFIVSVLVAEIGVCSSKLLPFDDFYVSVETNNWMYRIEGRDGLRVTVSVMRNSEFPQGRTSVKVNCRRFPNYSFLEEDLKVFYEASEAAHAGECFTKAIMSQTYKGKRETRFETIEEDGTWMIKVTHAGRNAVFAANEASKVREAMKQARSGEEWFKKLLIADELQEHTVNAKPPKSRGYSLSSELGRVSGGDISYVVLVSARSFSPEPQYRIEHQLAFMSNGKFTMYVTGGNVKTLLSKISEALDAIEEGVQYPINYDAKDETNYPVVANHQTKEADLTWSHKGTVTKGHFGRQQLEAIQGLIEDYESRKKWFQDHERLFYLPLIEYVENVSFGTSLDNELQKLRELTVISGSSVGVGGVPGEFYLLSLIFLEKGKMEEFRAMTLSRHPAVRVMGAYCLIRKGKQENEALLESMFSDYASLGWNPGGCIVMGGTKVGLIIRLLYQDSDILTKGDK